MANSMYPAKWWRLMNGPKAVLWANWRNQYTRVPSLVKDWVRPNIANRKPKMVMVLTIVRSRRGVSVKTRVAMK